jgi:hypothetical protein
MRDLKAGERFLPPRSTKGTLNPFLKDQHPATSKYVRRVLAVTPMFKGQDRQD